MATTETVVPVEQYPRENGIIFRDFIAAVSDSSIPLFQVERDTIIDSIDIAIEAGIDTDGTPAAVYVHVRSLDDGEASSAAVADTPLVGRQITSATSPARIAGSSGTIAADTVASLPLVGEIDQSTTDGALSRRVQAGQRVALFFTTTEDPQNASAALQTMTLVNVTITVRGRTAQA